MKATDTAKDAEAAGPRGQARARYTPPQLIEWGTLRDLTRGSFVGGQDGGAMGTENI